MRKVAQNNKSKLLKVIKLKLIVLYLLNVIDIAFTLFLISTGLFIEANTLMHHVVNTPFLAVLLKVTVPGILVIVIWKRLIEANPKQLIISNNLICISMGAYFLIILNHLFYLF